MQPAFPALILGRMHRDHRGACRVLAHHLTTLLRQVHRVVYVAPLGELCSRSDRQALQLYWYGSMRHIALLPDKQELRGCQSSSFSTLRSPQKCPLIDPVNVIYATQPGVTHESNTCVIGRLAFLNLGVIDLLSCTAPCHPPQPRIAGFWFVHEPQNLEITLREVGGFPNDCASVRRLVNQGCSKKVMKNELVNRSSDKQSESVNVHPASDLFLMPTLINHFTMLVGWLYPQANQSPQSFFRSFLGF